MSPIELVGAVASVATAVGVFFGWWQIRIVRRQNRTQFEDNLEREYRQLMQQFPVTVLFGEELKPEQYREALHLFYRYFDLTNGQIIHRRRRRVSKATWHNWSKGIRLNFSLPAVQQAWTEIKTKPYNRFGGLKRLEAEGFRTDPARWGGTTSSIPIDETD